MTCRIHVSPIGSCAPSFAFIAQGMPDSDLRGSFWEVAEQQCVDGQDGRCAFIEIRFTDHRHCISRLLIHICSRIVHFFVLRLFEAMHDEQFEAFKNVCDCRLSADAGYVLHA